MAMTQRTTTNDVERYLELARELIGQGRFAEGEACCRAVLNLNPHHAEAFSNLGWIFEKQDDRETAAKHYEKAVKLDETLVDARRKLAKLLVSLGRLEESLPIWASELRNGGLNWINDLISNASRERNLQPAGQYASILAALRWGSQWYPAGHGQAFLPIPPAPPDASLSIPKLLHDIEQFRYLQKKQILYEDFTPIIQKYEYFVERLTSLGINARTPLDEEAQQSIGHVYNRIVHVRNTPRVKRALSNSWTAAAVEELYLDHAPGVVVVDDFLSRDALEELHLFCLESTVWSSTRHAHGRIGSQFRNGFTCPLLLQIAEEIRDAFPRVIGNRYPLRHIWGYKSPPTLAEDATTHADFAAVNVNIWITPDDANLDEVGGGLVVYGVDAPGHWDFNMYNARLEDVIKPFLRRQQAGSVNIPYKQNRAVIFNSDLFHGTAELHFRPGYENQRINVTMLYGDRQDDVHHRGLARPDPIGDGTGLRSAWRSAVFSGFRACR